MFNRISSIVLAAVFAAGAASADNVTLRWGHYLGDSPFVQPEKDFASSVTERTEGRVNVEITFAGGLGGGGEVMTLAGRGAIDMASVVPGYYTDQLLFWRVKHERDLIGSPEQ
jgi:TRAP-type C4-dicarboxylate transport system substrate-binding protein